MLMESCGKFRHQQNTFAASQKNSVAAFIKWKWGLLSKLKKEKEKNIKWLHTACRVYCKSLEALRSHFKLKRC